MNIQKNLFQLKESIQQIVLLLIKIQIYIIKQIRSKLNEENILGLRMIMSEEQYYIEPIGFNLIN